MSASDAPSSNDPAPVPANATAPPIADVAAPTPANEPAPAVVDAIAPTPANTTPPAGSADEMIAQAAGEQIDELLAKADVERLTPEPDNQGTVAPAAAADASSPEVAVASKSKQPVQERSAPAPASEPQVAQEGTSAKGKPEAATVGAGQATAAQDAKSQSDAPKTEAPVTEASETDVVEADEEHDSQEQSQAPAWLIPLELINRPFEALPDSIRSALGKAAILTLINATALLVYVFKFRK